MNLRDLHIIYNKVPDFMGMTDGQIIGLYMIYEDGYVQFVTEVKYKNKDKTKIGLFGINMKNKSIDTLTKESYINLLEKINFVNKKDHYYKMKLGLERMEKVENIVEYDDYFIVIKDKSENVKFEASSTIKFIDINYEISANITVLYASPNISTSYSQIEIKKLDKSKLEDINFLTNMEVNISYENNLYNDRGNIRNIENLKDKLNVIIEPIEATLLETEMLKEIHFSQVTPEEIIKIIANVNNSFKVGEVDCSERKNRKFKYITTLNNFELEEEMLQIDDIIFSRSMDNIDTEKITPSSKKYVYVSTYITAETISKAQELAVQKIENAVNIIQLIQKNSCFYKLYNEKEKINDWDIRDIFIDYKLGERFYIFNIFESDQSVYGSNKGLTIKRIGYLSNQSDIVLYNDEINGLIANNKVKENNLPNAIYWLNKGIEEINIDLNKCVLYLNIALEYCINGEKGKSFFKQNEEVTEIFNNIEEYLNEKYTNNKVATDMKNKLKNALTSSSVKNRFESMLENLKINYTKEQFKTYNKIRDARNDIIHGRKKVEIQKHDIIDFYMLLSKVMFFKLKER